MTGALFDSISAIARHEATARPTAAIGVVDDVFDGAGVPPDHAVTVTLRDSGLVLPRIPVAVGALGLAATPEAGDLVLVIFADGDYHAPVVVGALYHSDLAPGDHGPGDIVLRLPAGSTSPSFQAVLRGSDPTLEVTLGEDVALRLSDREVHVVTGDAEVTLASASGGRAEVKVGDATLTLTGRGDIEVNTSGKLTFKASEIEMQGQASVKISAPQVEVN